MASMQRRPNFDWTTAPLDRNLSLEASAGTGKTYTLEHLVYRLIVEKKVPLESILVVTYTNKAAREMQDRIRRLLWQKRSSARNEEAQLLSQACLDFDRASIYTIHGFCNYVLGSFSFEMGLPFKLDMTQDTRGSKETIMDWFRSHDLRENQLFYHGYNWTMEKGDFSSLMDQLVQDSAKGYEYHQGLVYPNRQAAEQFYTFFEQGVDHELLQALQEWDSLMDKGELAKQLIDQGAPKKRRKPTLEGFLVHWEEFKAAGFKPMALLKFLEQKNVREILSEEYAESSSAFQQCKHEISRSIEIFNKHWGDNWGRSLSACFRLELLDQLYQKKLRNWKNQMNYNFDELISAVHRSLCSEEENNDLLLCLQRRFKTLLIDEFQDTDQRQWEIFQKIFHGSPRHNYFLIGDPKQSIYRFRNADLNIYFQAVNQLPPENLYQLGTNYRSTPELVEVFNRIFDPLFQQSGGAIEHHPVQSGKEEPPYLTRNGQVQSPLHFTDLQLEGEKPKIGPARGAWFQAIVNHVEQLLVSPDYQLADGPVRAGDIALLVETNAQGEELQDLLSHRNIPSVISGEKDIFESPVFPILRHFFYLLCHPGDQNSLGFLLLSFLSGWSRKEYVLARSKGLLDQFSMEFREYQKRAFDLETLFLQFWKSLGQLGQQLDELPAARKEALAQQVELRILSMPQGERIFTDLEHLLEIFQRERQQQSLEWKDLITLADSTQFRSSLEEQKKLRLDKDGQAVQILSLHSSKGLQFPLVFFAGAQGSTSSRLTGWLRFTQDGKLCQSDVLRQDWKDQHLKEEWQEKLRLYYVAFTRAETRLYLPLFSPQPKNRLNKILQCAVPALLSDHQSFLADWQSLVALEEAPSRTAGFSQCKETSPMMPSLDCAPFGRRYDRLSSFSGLVRNQDQHGLVQQEGQRDLDLDDEGQDRPELTELPKIPRHFPGGADLGNLVHHCFENVDFNLAQLSHEEFHGHEELHETLQEYSRAFFPAPWFKEWGSCLKDWIYQTLNYPMEDLKGASLSSLSNRDKIHELEFHLRVKPGILSLEQRRWKVDEGFLKGFLDLIFLWQGRYYVLDWKTTANSSHPLTGGYGKTELDQIMEHHHYDLQAKIYWVALYRHLKQLQGSSFQYEQMGGVFYLFLRGMDNIQEGVWFHRPTLDDTQNFMKNIMEDSYE